MSNNIITKHFVHCKKCNKRLIERLPNGLWRFIFGKRPEGVQYSPVEILIQGSIKIRCIRRTCGEWNILNYFPNEPQSALPEKEPAFEKPL